MANVKRVSTLQDPVRFSDLRDLEAAERKRLELRRNLLRDISAPGSDGTPRKRSLTPEEKAELKEIDQKLATDDIVDPMFKAVQKGLSLAVLDHKGGLFPSQQAVEIVHSITVLGTAVQDWKTVVELAGLKTFDTQDQLANLLPAVLQYPAVSALLKQLFDIFDQEVGKLSFRPTKRQLKVISDAVRKIRDTETPLTEPVKQFLTKLSEAVDLSFVSGSESLIDWLLAIDKKVPPATLNPNLTDGEKNLAGRRLHHAAVAAPNVLLDDVFERIARDLGRLDQALLAARHVGDDDGGTTRRALGIERSEDLELHDDPSPKFGLSPPPLRGRVREGGSGWRNASATR